MDNLLDGKSTAKKIQAHLQEQVQIWQAKVGRPPGLAVIMVGENPGSVVYVRNKEQACARVGIASFGQHFPAETRQEELTRIIHELNKNEQVDGILVQLPLPANLDSVGLLYEIAPNKDADGLHPENLGRLARGERGLRSCTPAGVMRLFEEYNIELKGKHAVVLGRSILVGKPMALMLLEADCTVTIAHSKTQDLAKVSRDGDIVVAAIGRPQMITADFVKPGAIVIDVGINKITDNNGKSRLVGDVDFESVQPIAQYITPVPGGIGPMTVAMLLQNTFWSYLQKVQ